MTTDPFAVEILDRYKDAVADEAAITAFFETRGYDPGLMSSIAVTISRVGLSGSAIPAEDVPAASFTMGLIIGILLAESAAAPAVRPAPLSS